MDYTTVLTFLESEQDRGELLFSATHSEGFTILKINPDVSIKLTSVFIFIQGSHISECQRPIYNAKTNEIFRSQLYIKNVLCQIDPEQTIDAINYFKRFRADFDGPQTALHKICNKAKTNASIFEKFIDQYTIIKHRFDIDKLCSRNEIRICCKDEVVPGGYSASPVFGGLQICVDAIEKLITTLSEKYPNCVKK